MTKIRRSSIGRSNRELRNAKGPNGGRLCRYCKIEVKPPRRTFCSDACVHEWKLRSNVKYLRDFVYQRDLGICAICKVDTRYQKIDLENSQRLSRTTGDMSHFTRMCKDLRITEKEAMKSIWHADHILPVSQGGGESGLDNIRTLCVKCHKSETKLLASKRKTK
jgi:5-methylcytosine-specific restriction enzyme A